MLLIPFTIQPRSGLFPYAALLLTILCGVPGSRLTHGVLDPPVKVRQMVEVRQIAEKPVRVVVNSAVHSPADLCALQEALGPAVDVTGPRKPTWWDWIGLDGPRAACAISGSPAPFTVALYATRLPDGVSVCLVNRSQQKRPVLLQVRLPAGIYTIERLTLERLTLQSVSSPRSGAARPAAEQPDEAERPTAPLLHRYKSQLLSENGTLAKPCDLAPGAVCLVRFRNQLALLRSAQSGAYRELSVLAKTAPAPVRLLRRILNEALPFESGLRTGSALRRSQAKRLHHAHQILLRITQAQARLNNDRALGTLHGEAVERLLAHLDRAQQAVAEMSAALLGLTPQIQILPDQPPRAAAVAVRDTPAQETGRAAHVIVTLANAGSEDVQMVRIGLATTPLPPGVTCLPAEASFFGTLRPGQTARAEFRLHAAESALRTERPGALDVQCIGLISYFAAHTLAHLRPHGWLKAGLERKESLP